ncbi:alkaline shock response membrane anchor protein AmaP [Aerococcus kribbianus]|uniref:Alkaline shock response membrane anchor protein AmaP n=1 Tax=Aerococcus kribbianus TaxID=2999064 RepID=A0A9X3FNN7_9LACT|nr:MULTISPECIES: alkaline shock response membrane anchor protein AmaP [unclassified Aerococcus]MCZ0717760.1 alkaline shock response membrane anchor protein AmaP [Aerococcus sp. YH-aer221]MCZ0726048.1 alkaline shock response membrane anchor protein AmaP [Aerococcus sp. YH-aer222]
MTSFRKWVQAIIALFVIVGLVFSIAIFFPIPYVTNFVFDYILVDENLRIVVAVALGLITIYLIGAVLYALFARGKSKKLSLANDKGKIVVESESVEMCAYNAIRNVTAARNKNVKVKLGSDVASSKADVSFDIDQDKDVVGISNDIQNRVQSALEAFFGQPIKTVNVKANPYDSSQNVEASSRDQGRRVN